MVAAIIHELHYCAWQQVLGQINKHWHFILSKPDQIGNRNKCLTRLAILEGHHEIGLYLMFRLSLSRLAWYYMQNDSIYQQANLSQNGLTMLVQTLLQQHQDELQLYGNLLTKQGFIGQFTTQLLELKQSGLSWGDVTAMADGLTNQETLQMKLHDLATVGRSLETELTQRGQYLSSDLLLALKVYLATEKTDISHHYFFINDYSQMTSPERGLVEALITYAGGVTIALRQMMDQLV